MRVLFLWPNFDCPIGPSCGVAYLSGGLRAAGHDTKILHICEGLGYPYDPDRIESDVRAYGPGLIAVSTGANHYPDMQRLCARLKRALDVPIVFGGIHTTLNTFQVLSENPWLDFANFGEGDDSILDLARAIETSAPTHSIANVWTRHDGQIVRNAARPLRDLTTLPWMDLDGWDFEKITRLRRGWVNVFMNRGCPYRCTYCHNNGIAKVLQQNFGAKTASNADIGYLRLRGIDDMIGELKAIRDRFDSVTAFSFNDDTFTMNQDHAKAFLRRYKQEVGVPFVCNTTVLDVDREMLEVMKEAGCDLVRFGVETASRRIRRDVLKRDFSNVKTEEAFDNCREIGLRSLAFNILANPTETQEEMLDTLRLNARLQPSAVRISLGYPYPGTEYYEIAERLDTIDPTRLYHNYSQQSRLKWTDGERLWIDKVRTFYWWWINAYLDNACSPVYRALTDMVLAMEASVWKDEASIRKLFELDATTSALFTRQDVPHYSAPFSDRPDITLLQCPKPVERQMLDEH